MIVDPDFLDHWRTGMVVDALDDSMAPMYILRLWAHCQERKSDTFVMPTRGLKAQCKFPGDAQAFEAALIEAGFVERDGDSIHVCGWAEKNASLLAAWANGNKGGRKPKQTQSEPTGNPRVTQTEPKANQSETHAEPIRVDKSREDKKLEEPTVLVGSASDPTPPRIPCPTEKLVAAFHEHCPTLPRVMKLTSERRKKLASRWREVDADSSFESEDDGVTIFAEIFKRVHASDFLSGRAGSWKAGFDWLFENEKHILKVCEGNYDNGKQRA